LYNISGSHKGVAQDSGLAGISRCVIGWLTLEDEDIMFIRNFEEHSPSDTASHPRRPESEVSLDIRSDYTLFWKPV